MSSEPAIRIRGLGKRYPATVGRRAQTARDRLSSWFHRDADALGAWALEDVSFDVAAGRSLGLVGANGAGKSTLLRVLARITEPTRGRVEIRGRVASLLDLGAGFHSELTGRENVFLNGTILGMRRHEIAAKLESIVEFAELSARIDAPVKTYSSGMQLRLAFAIAAHLDSDVLLVDEVLAVGDARFQRRCLARMSEVLRDGRTVVLVSHSLELVRRVCDDAVWLDRGRVRSDGNAARVIDAYLAEALGPETGHRPQVPEPLDTRGGLALVSFGLVGADGSPRSRFAEDEWIGVRIEVEGPPSGSSLGVAILGAGFEELAGSVAPDDERLSADRRVLLCSFEPFALGSGEYALEVVCGDPREPARFGRSSRSLAFAVVPADEPHPSRGFRIGTVALPARWETR